jgi:diacylglycerol O-acyltransferase
MSATERMSGSDAVLWHMEDDLTPMHTLKVVILDTRRRGRPLTLDDLALAVGSRLGLVPRATQRVISAPGFGGRPFWVHDPDFDLRQHLDERTLLEPGDQRELDALYGELATGLLPRDRAPWAMTLVHGLEGGRQAVVVRVHHAIVDGLGALNAFVAATTEEPGRVVDLAPPVTAERLTRTRLALSALRDTLSTWRYLPEVARKAAAARRRGRTDPNPDIPRFLRFGRTSLSTPGGVERTCASGSLDLATMRAIGKATGSTVNGVLHAVVAGALRAELAERGEDVSVSCIGAFGMASDPGDTTRLVGNQVTPTFVHLRSDLADPLDRLEATARSCRAAVEARREVGLDLTEAMSAHAPRLLNHARRVTTRRSDMSPGDVVTANVPGPARRRWLGDIEVVDWFSFAVAVHPASVNVTVHSYDGRMNVGVVAVREALPEPQRLIARLAEELQVLAEAVGSVRATAVA